MDEPLIGILMATYNGEKFVSEQIDSILSQTYKNWVLLIHDDGSNASTIDILRSYQNGYPQRIILIDDGIRCGGAKENFAYLFKIAKINYNFDYIMFSDQDDVWLPFKIETVLKQMIESENKYPETPICVYTDLTVVDENLKLISNSCWKYQRINPAENTTNRLLSRNVAAGCTMILNRAAFNIIFNIPEKSVIHDWWVALVVSTFGKMFYIGTSTILYRQHAFNVYGVDRWSFFVILKRFFSKGMLKDFKINFNKSILQAEALIKEYCNLLDDFQKSLIKHYIDLPQCNKITRLYFILKYKYFGLEHLFTLIRVMML